MGRDLGIIFSALSGAGFQSTRPVWGATSAMDYTRAKAILFQSTRPVWGATRGIAKNHGVTIISIHAPRVGRDRAAGGIWR